MQRANSKSGKKKNKPAANDQSAENKNISYAHQQAEKDIEKDPDLSMHSPNDDLDESETARLGEDKTDLV